MNREMIKRRPLRIPEPEIESEDKGSDEEEFFFEKQGHNLMKLGQGVYLGDIDKMLETVERQMPIVNTEQIYLWELERHERIYLAITIIGIMMVVLGVLI